MLRTLLVVIALASAAGPARAADEAGTGPQTITLYVRGVDAGTSIEAERPDVGTITLVDPAIGLLRGRFHGEPARFLQLRLTAVRADGRRPVYDGLVVVGDADEETLAFAFDPLGPAKRLPVAPSLKVDVALDPRVTWWVGFGWGALALGYVGLLGGMWAVRRR